MHRPISLPAPRLQPEPPAGAQGLSAASQMAKRLLDVGISAVLLLLLLPFMLAVAVLLACTSGAPVLFFQERIGRYNKPFRIIKFRSMIIDAEAKGPQLSFANDPRITPLGRLLRKWRVDELPQLWNVLRGDMSLVGPRPERAFYREVIISQLPAYRLVTNVRPGITSLGMVRWGYAENMDELVARARIDLQYLNRQSLSMDGRILLQTIRIICLAKGK